MKLKARAKAFLERLHSQKPLIMGILNVTPDSFSDGGEFYSVEAACQRALRMVEEGAEIIDIGGESTRPGSDRVPAEEQLRRVLPVIEALAPQLPDHVYISIDTSKRNVARAALDCGAVMINDVFAGRDDPEILRLAAEHGVPIVLMHMQGTPKTMQDNPTYSDVVTEVEQFLRERIEAAKAAGVEDHQIVLDPGIGFGKRRDNNLRLLAHLDRFVALGYPILLGTSRKRFMGAVLEERDPKKLLAATVATTALGVWQGVRIFRVHDVNPNRDALEVTWAILEQR